LDPSFGISGLIEPTTHIVVVHGGIWVTNWIDEISFHFKNWIWCARDYTKEAEIKAKFTNWGPHVNLCISMNEKSVLLLIINLPIRIMTFKICKPIPAEPREIGAARWETLYTCNVQL
jgi:hypothetical protein